MSEPSSAARARLHVEDVITYSRHALAFLGKRSDREVEDDLQCQFAIVRALEVVGEATRSIPENVRSLATDVPWRDIVAMRNRIVHHYFGVRLGIVLNVVRHDLPPLIEAMSRLLEILSLNEPEDNPQ